VPSFVRGEQVRDVALVPDVAAGLFELGAAAGVGEGAVAGLLVAALEVADDPPAAVVVDPARRPLREHHREDVEPLLGVGVEEVTDGLAPQRLPGLAGDRVGVGQQGGHRRAHGLGPGPVVGQRGVGQGGLDGGGQAFERGRHGTGG
jgi:hypothetical protein